MKNNLKVISCVIFYLLFSLNVWWCNGETEDVGAIMEKTEKEALYSAIQGFVGSLWNGSDLYPDPCGWTPIQGVSCDLINEFWYVTDLSIGPLHDNSLSCTQNPEFRPQIFELKHLKSLSFFNCFVSPNNLFTLPTNNWEKLAPTLESLEFRSNPSLVGPIPSTFGNLKNLQSLVLIENGITATFPTNIGNLVHLKRLVISGNKFSGRIPETLGNLKELLILDLSRNALSGHLPISIGYLISLLKLDLSNNMLVGNIPSNIGNLKSLTLLDLRGNNISGGLTRSIEEMDSLQELVLSSNPVGGDINNVDWQKLQNLIILDLSNLGLSGEFPKSMIKLKKLRYVGLGNNHLTGDLPSDIANMPGVGAIYVNGNNLTGELKFSETFYGRLGRRFGAWNNPNLCYTGGRALIGVLPCKSEEKLVKTNLKYGLGDENGKLLQQHSVWITPITESNSLNPNSISSLGVYSSAFDGVWWVFLVESFMMVFLWNFFL
ncbi:piriformospora indica-insensitive protein 2 [Beta vulgaris subsp. vulgaris]|uniref:piriformospora indica-insensitive protein 2 n=1 Tax=Beta vulgaris subsp. vulgaris TaxID=3555 RepID=UPI002036D343|nr:piriformospora indica-insensitive protein 2 [Beta vulgaris subsp. vulgaris]